VRFASDLNPSGATITSAFALSWCKKAPIDLVPDPFIPAFQPIRAVAHWDHAEYKNLQ
jgi:hypothetical protein